MLWRDWQVARQYCYEITNELTYYLLRVFPHVILMMFQTNFPVLILGNVWSDVNKTCKTQETQLLRKRERVAFYRKLQILSISLITLTKHLLSNILAPPLFYDEPLLSRKGSSERYIFLLMSQNPKLVLLSDILLQTPCISPSPIKAR